MTKPRSVAATANDSSIPGSRLKGESITQDKFDPSVSFPVSPGSVDNEAVAEDAAISSSKLEFTANDPNAKPRPVSSKLGDWFNVKDFGAKGDEITDDTAEIEAAISAVSAVGGGNLFFPAGVYITSAAISTKEGVNLIGEGRGETWIKSSAASVLITEGDGCPDIKRMTLSTTNTTAAETDRRALYVKSTGLMVRVTLEDLQLRCNNGPGYGLYIEGLCINTTFNRCVFDKSIKVTPINGAVFNSNRFDNCRFGITTPHSFNSQRICEIECPANSQVITFLNCTFEYGNVLIRRTGPSGALNQIGLYACWMGDDLVGGQTLTLDALGSVTIDGCYFYDVDMVVNDVVRGCYRNVQAKSCTFTGDCDNTYIENCSATGNFYGGLGSAAANYCKIGDSTVEIKTGDLEFDVANGFGINTSTPGQLLHIQARGINTPAGIRLNPTNVGGGVSPYAEIVAYQNGSSSSDLAFFTKNSDAVNESLRVTKDKVLLVGGTTQSGTAGIQVESDKINLRIPKTPTSAAAGGIKGDIAWDENYVYVCVNTNTWKRAALSSW